MPEVWNKRHGNIPAGAVYVGRPTKYGNRFTHLRTRNLAEVQVGSAEEAVAEYEKWLLTQPDLIADVKRELKGKDLICWCVPGPCHANVLLRIANEE